MSLGALLAQWDDPARIARLLPELGDADWREKLAAASQDGAPESFAKAAVARFSAEAGDEEWMSLIAALNRAADPGALCLRRMIDWVFAREDAARAVGGGKG